MTQQAKSWLIGAIVVVVIVIGAIWINAARHDNNGAPNAESNVGRIVVGVTDASTDLTNIESVVLTIDSVEIKAAGQDWITLTSSAKNFDLLALKQSGTVQVATDANVTADTYDQIRINMSKASVTAKGKAAVDAKLPANEMTITARTRVNAGETSTILLDFLLDSSLHAASNNQFILTPVVKFETKTSADISSDSTTLDINSGTTLDSATVGMDIDGTVKPGFTVSADLDLIGSTIHGTDPNQKETGLKITATKAIELAKQSGKIDTAISVHLVMQNDKKTWQVIGLSGTSLVSVMIDATSGTVVEASGD